MKKLLVFALTFISVIWLGGCNTKSDSIGIIGGADGPTAVFVSSDINWLWIFGFIGAIAVAVLVVLILCRKKKQ